MTDLFAEPEFFREALGFTRQHYGFPERLIEKDYLCSLLLEYLCDAHKNLVFKGERASPRSMPISIVSAKIWTL